MHAARWWLFYIDQGAPTLIKTRSSADFITWSDGDSLALPFGHGNEGRTFSVAYADLGGRDVVHITSSLRVASVDRRRFHARATITSQPKIDFEPAYEAHQLTTPCSPLDPDNPVDRKYDGEHGQHRRHADRAVGRGFGSSQDVGASFVQCAQSLVPRVQDVLHAGAFKR